MKVLYNAAVENACLLFKIAAPLIFFIMAVLMAVVFSLRKLN